MERTLSDYIRALRTAGASVSTIEAIDAARTLDLVGYGDRGTLKRALGVALAKSAEDKALHDRMFDLYFNRAADAAAASAASPHPEAAGQEPGESDDLVSLSQSDDPGRVAMALERAAKAVGADGIKFASQASFFVRRMLEELGVERLDAELLKALEARTPEGEARAQELMAARSDMSRRARALVDDRFEVFGRAATEAFMNEVMAERAISDIGRGDMDRMRLIVARMAKRLAARHSRRRKVKDRGQLDIRRTLRANAGHDGVPFDVVWKTRKRDRPKIVAICDVSGSVARYVRFLLLFLYALRGKVADLEAFAFSAKLKDVGPELANLPFETAMMRIVSEVGGGSTDYGQAFVDMRDRYGSVIDRRTTILVLGDGRSNQADPEIGALKELADRARRIIWLSPEPPSRWGTGDSCLLDYRPYCASLTHCSTAADLEMALDDLLLDYG